VFNSGITGKKKKNYISHDAVEKITPIREFEKSNPCLKILL